MKHTFVMIQTQPGPDDEENMREIIRLIHEAAALYQPELILLPETCAWDYSAAADASGRDPLSDRAAGPDSPFILSLRKLAAKYGTWLVSGILEKAVIPGEAGGSGKAVDPEKTGEPGKAVIPEKTGSAGGAEDGRCYNTVLVINDAGDIVTAYRKTHLYDAFESRESDLFLPGDSLFDPVDTPFGRIGVFVCYELRFPEVARSQRARGADILLVPSAWVRGEMKSEHFRTLVMARAIENTAYVLACNKSGNTAMGESLAVDPMGVVTAYAGRTAERRADERAEAAGGKIIPVTVDTDRITQVRRILPSFEERRPELYG
ncbi:MAG: amidohydrolase [Lachnospiraceae bacterium]|nr:amidohydrolase [Lachnospiraceae bacterium]